ncbi:hypothetical protein GS506_12235 [Rhodococcus hoagii]|nr:hypothetical protein [Prescottella equi]
MNIADEPAGLHDPVRSRTDLTQLRDRTVPPCGRPRAAGVRHARPGGSQARTVRSRHRHRVAAPGRQCCPAVEIRRSFGTADSTSPSIAMSAPSVLSSRPSAGPSDGRPRPLGALLPSRYLPINTSQ